MLVPVNVHTVKEAIEDAFTTAAGGEGTHRADAAAHFDEGSAGPNLEGNDRMQLAGEMVLAGEVLPHGLLNWLRIEQAALPNSVWVGVF